jgi:hypothetical protein
MNKRSTRLRYRHLRRLLRRHSRRLRAVTLMRLFNFQRGMILRLQRLANFGSRCLATIVGAAIGALFLLAAPKAALLTHVSEASLAVIPAQKAAEAFSAAILKIYARDSTLMLVFVLLTVSCMSSVFFGTGWRLGLPPLQSLAIQFVLLGISLDGLRLFYTRTLYLLIPGTAVALVLKQCNRAIAKVRRTVDRIARILQTEHGPPETQAASRALLFAGSQIAAGLRGWITQLDEFAHKAVARGDTEAVNTILTAMRTISAQYIDARRTSVVLVPDWNNLFAGGSSDISQVLEPIHESIRVICQRAAKGENELVVRQCIQTLGAMTTYAMGVIHDQSGRRQTTPLAYSPCFYLDLCVQTAIRANLPDAVLAAVEILQGILLTAAKDVDTSTVEAKALETCSPSPFPATLHRTPSLRFPPSRRSCTLPGMISAYAATGGSPRLRPSYATYRFSRRLRWRWRLLASASCRLSLLTPLASRPTSPLYWKPSDMLLSRSIDAAGSVRFGSSSRPPKISSTITGRWPKPTSKIRFS